MSSGSYPSPPAGRPDTDVHARQMRMRAVGAYVSHEQAFVIQDVPHPAFANSWRAASDESEGFQKSEKDQRFH